MDRRFFMQNCAASLAGYSLCVSAAGAAPHKGSRVRSKAEGSLLADVLGVKPAAVQASAGVPERANFLETRAIKCDVLVAGGGLAGICAALAAARAGRKTVLVQDRSRLGGNSSSEIRMHPLGVDSPKTGWREGGIIEELKLENAARNPQLSWDMWDFILYDKCVSQKNLTLLLDTTLCAADVKSGKIASAGAVCRKNRIYYKISAKIYIDATGDADLAALSGCSLMGGRESPEKFGETLAAYDLPGGRQGSSILFMSRDFGRPMPFAAPAWARKITEPTFLRGA